MIVATIFFPLFFSKATDVWRMGSSLLGVNGKVRYWIWPGKKITSTLNTATSHTYQNPHIIQYLEHNKLKKSSIWWPFDLKFFYSGNSAYLSIKKILVLSHENPASRSRSILTYIKCWIRLRIETNAEPKHTAQLWLPSSPTRTWRDRSRASWCACPPARRSGWQSAPCRPKSPSPSWTFSKEKEIRKKCFSIDHLLG